MRFRLLASLSLLFALVTTSLIAQTMSTPPPGRSVPNQLPSPNPVPDEKRDEMQRQMAKKANEERQAQLKRDTDHLCKLANELKQYVDKSNENTLSLEVVKKAEEIEKLAHSVKEKMKGN